MTINTENYRANTKRLIQLLQEFLIDSLDAHWLTSDRLFHMIKKIDNLELRETCEECWKELEQCSGVPIDPSANESDMGNRTYLYDNLRIEDKNALIQLNPFRLKIDSEGLAFANDRKYIIQQKRTPISIFDQARGSIELFNFRQSLILEEQGNAYEGLAKLLIAADKIHGNIAPLIAQGYQVRTSNKWDSRAVYGCADVYDLHFYHVCAIPGDLGKLNIVSYDDLEPIAELKLAHANDLLDWIQKYATGTSYLQNASKSSASPALQSIEPKKIPWIGTDVDFAALIVELRNKGYIKANSDMAALEFAIPHFDGINTNSRVLLQGKANRQYLGLRTSERSFSCIPVAKQRKKAKPAAK